MQKIYTCLFYLIQPLIWLRLLYRSIKTPAYRQRWPERYGFRQNKVKPGGIIIHAVSVGEAIASTFLVKALQEKYPNIPITITTMTPTGSEQVKILFGHTVSHVYLPYDLPGALNRFINTARPKLMIIIETELWPNLITLLHKRAIPLIIANARLSDRSTQKYQRFAKSIKQLLTKIPLVAAQNSQSGDNFIKLGLPCQQLVVTGSIKFDVTLSPTLIEQAKKLRTGWANNRFVWIAASTYEYEDRIILSTYKKLLIDFPSLLLIIIPRHAERFNPLKKLINSQGFNLLLRSQHQAPTIETQIILGDTMGELLLLYGCADIAFVGGSLFDRGGHNPLEPALHRLPILMGQHVFNFPVICQQLETEGGLITVDENTLLPTMKKLLTDAPYRKKIGEQALAVVKQNQGALDRLLKQIDNYLN